MKRTIDDVTFAFLDTETTGLSPRRGARVCELAILPVRGGKAGDMFQSLINPKSPIDPGAQAVHGISSEMVAGSPTFRELAPRVHALLKGAVLVCHNIPFDVAFMEAEFQAAGLRMPDIPQLDTLRLARRQFQFASNALGNIANACDIRVERWHRAGADVRTLERVFDRLLGDLKKREKIRTLGDLMALQEPKKKKKAVGR